MLACWPPGPPDALNDTTSSRRGMRTPRETGRSSSAIRRCSRARQVRPSQFEQTRTRSRFAGRFSGPPSPTRSRTPMTAGTRFDGRTALVTGAASGIGRATALRLGADGASVGCLDLSDGADQTVGRHRRRRRPGRRRTGQRERPRQRGEGRRRGRGRVRTDPHPRQRGRRAPLRHHARVERRGLRPPDRRQPQGPVPHGPRRDPVDARQRRRRHHHGRQLRRRVRPGVHAGLRGVEGRRRHARAGPSPGSTRSSGSARTPSPPAASRPP